MRLGLPFLRQARNHKKYTQTKIAVLVNFPLLAGRGRFQYNLRLLLELSLCARVMSKKCAKTQGTIYIYITLERPVCLNKESLSITIIWTQLLQTLARVATSAHDGPYPIVCTDTPSLCAGPSHAEACCVFRTNISSKTQLVFGSAVQALNNVWVPFPLCDIWCTCWLAL